MPIVHCAVYDELADWEAAHLLARVNAPRGPGRPGRFSVVTVAESGKPVTTMGGLQVIPDLTLGELTAAQSAMLVLPGAGTWERGGNRRFATTARSFLASGVPVAAISGATLGLAEEGLLNDRRHTSNTHLYIAGAEGYSGHAFYRADRAVTDGDLITASGTAPLDFARAALERLARFAPPGGRVTASAVVE
jgi:putative intracellular protease/amidase